MELDLMRIFFETTISEDIVRHRRQPVSEKAASRIGLAWI
jgi:hypothetical protein